MEYRRRSLYVGLAAAAAGLLCGCSSPDASQASATPATAPAAPPSSSAANSADVKPAPDAKPAAATSPGGPTSAPKPAPKPASIAAPVKPPAANAPPAKATPRPATAGPAPTPTATATPASTPTDASNAQIPADLKSDGYYYYGLDNPKPMNMVIEIAGSPERKMTGTQTIQFKAMENGAPVFKIVRTGDLGTNLGQQELRLEKDGLINTASTIAKIAPHDIELPAELIPGKTTWPNKLEVENGASPMTLNSVSRVVGMQKIATPFGERQALLVTSTGQGTLEGKKVQITSKFFFVKHVGNVKSVLDSTYSDGRKQEITIEETK